MLENRRHRRVREFLKVHWSIEGRKDEGEGVAFNISLSGMQLLTDKIFKPSDGTIICVEAPKGETLPFKAKKAKILRFSRKKLRDGGEGFSCGLQFIKESQFDKQLQDWADGKTEWLSSTTDTGILSNYLF